MHTLQKLIGSAIALVLTMAPFATYAQGTAVGPGQDLFVTDGLAGTITRIDPTTGADTPFASGLPPALIGLGGVIDVAFIGGTAYALVTLVGADVGGSDTVGIYRIDGPATSTVIADIGQWSIDNPPSTPFDLPTGLQFSLHVYRGHFLVADGHHNRVLEVGTDGAIDTFLEFGNVVPTGLEVWGDTVFVALAGPTPHLPQDGMVVSYNPGASGPTLVASGAPLAVDVARGRGGELYVLSQGIWDGQFPGSPALPNTGTLYEIRPDGSLRVVASNLNLPASMEIIQNTAYVSSLAGTITEIHNIGGPPF